MELLIVCSFFCSAVLFFTFLLKVLHQKKEKVERRVKRYLEQSEPEILESKKNKFTLQFRLAKENIRKRLQKKNKTAKLEIELSSAGLPLKPEEFVMFQWIAGSLGAGILYLVFNQVFLAPIGGIIGMCIPRTILKSKQKKRLQKFNEVLPEMISTIVGALRAGFSFPQALKSVMEEAESPLKEEIATVLREMQYGTSMEDSLNHLKERMPSEDLDLMIEAILIQRQVGGNLATILEKIVETIRDRIKIQGQIQTLTAQGRLSGIVIGLLPVFLGGALFLIEPSYIGTLFTHPIGIILVIIAIISCAIGFMFIRKLTTIEV
ncbi:type II secretion system F family protein [Litchfieldia alkalitelluris]|uniref:type II secretion system F family protein n=1 Tax=Litchfieldia alkalitelluris TaxID=304268 RepID=UPI0009960E43|nr:type II secretion system F family protein [Litchfieldia alkalitelluris]